MITKTSTRVDSLPDDLRAIAKDMLSEKFPNPYPMYEFNSDEEEWIVGPTPNTMILKPRSYGKTNYKKIWEEMMSMFYPNIGATV